MQALPHTFDQSLQQLLCALLEYGTQVGHLLAYPSLLFSFALVLLHCYQMKFKLVIPPPKARVNLAQQCWMP